ncbi:MAG: DUF4097 family beta strand repeat-containing protein [Bacteroidota bacterium]
MKPTTFKQHIYTLSLLVFLALPAFVYSSNGPGCGFDEYVKTYDGTFAINQSGAVKLLNRHGFIKVTHHNRNEVEIDVRVVVQARDQQAANKVFDRIGVSMNGSEARVTAQTSIRVNNNSWDHGEFKVEYNVRLPTSVELDIDAKYCDVYVDDHEGRAQMMIKYGDLFAESFSDYSQIRLEYGDAEIDRLGNTAQISMSYGDLDLNDAGDLDLRLRYSDTEIDRVSSLNLDHRYGELEIETAGDVFIDAGYIDIEIDEVANIRARSQYSEYAIGSVRGNVDIETGYGDIDIETLHRGFQEVKIRGNYSDVEINVESGYSYEFSGYAAHGSLSVPSNLAVNRREDGGSSRTIEGRLASSGSGGNIHIWTNYGDIEID